ncbi:hypothetical protein F751_6533 [Auxenochlorella protothecoides]|uniref:Uncharacterized protein n=1 Tax=Auxenochlorella protothecoides TaxID=3075 RepID=A0A087STG0_AUXPR|nr:hypothetical protein F751_6533 [Auxenochlorella protothecoides]KFM29014.1 hypothetical protein F751_6533 [Auxenochlorella protothecoides]
MGWGDKRAPAIAGFLPTTHSVLGHGQESSEWGPYLSNPHVQHPCQTLRRAPPQLPHLSAGLSTWPALLPATRTGCTAAWG